ncbi:DUF4129 domain-containing protein [Bacillus lacus]|uniref:DUF4129 domain-containing protein n=1 Tax=Metabacillus lacus TaxID=1983721 RepID=A0A7X2J2K8_9BACI|nr:transglutaminase domain-containing protein [Metabacillus lacus]MRX74129.1 DUF4129 domain-containing protein [Metabacillus lacus]
MEHNRSLAASLLYYIAAFVLLWEWLRPLQDFTDTQHTVIFITFIAFSFMLAYLQAKWYISFPVKIAYILFILHLLFYEGSMFARGWLPQVMEDIIYNAGMIQQAAWIDMTSSFRTLLFFILLWLLVYLLHYWILHQNRIMFFLILTFVYITVLDTFSPYDASGAIVRTVFIGFFLGGYLYFERLGKSENFSVGRGAKLKWLLVLTIFISSATAIGLAAPKADPIWPDPVPYLTAYGREDDDLMNSSVKRIGYGTNDEQLGGPFIQDDTPVFTAETQRRHYWRVETKTVYTGKGWLAYGDQQAPPPIEMPADSVKVQWFDESVPKQRLTANVSISPDYAYPHVIYPLGFASFSSEEPAELLVSNEATELFYPRLSSGRGQARVYNYTVEYDYPTYDINDLKAAPIWKGAYSYVPEDLPQRVKDLALQLTEGYDNQYDKVKAVERYLGSENFEYNTEEVAIPGPEDDYVDQFLFETMKGYCDNFSTSMTVLLNTLDIPARWIKGYTEGEYTGNISGSMREYEVTNNNAHSWVEVYFDGIGWVPFEPTKGYSNPYNFTYNIDTDASEEPDVPEETQTQDTERPVEEDTEEAASQNQNNWWQNISFSFGEPYIYVVIGIFLMFATAVFFTRGKWLPLLAVYRFKNQRDGEVYFKAYNALLKHLERSGLQRKNGQTLRDFAAYVDRYYGSRDMMALTASYERALYRNDDAREEWEKSVELWENLIKRTSP